MRSEAQSSLGVIFVHDRKIVRMSRKKVGKCGFLLRIMTLDLRTFFFAIAVFAGAWVDASGMEAGSDTNGPLKVEGQSGWLATDEIQPMLSWSADSGASGDTVTGYELVVSKTAVRAGRGEADWWASGVLPVSRGPRVIFDASQLPAREEVWWSVRSVLAGGERGKWETPAVFDIGLRKAENWRGEWIGMDPQARQRSAPQFRKMFQVRKPVARARLYVCGLGWHESWLNGARLGDEVLQPAQTDYERRVFYVAHDVTSQVRQGDNAIGIWVGDGFYHQDRVWGPKGLSYGEPRVRAQLEITYKDGERLWVPTDSSWQCKVGPVVSSNVYAGEEFDARSDDARWAATDGKTEGWMPVRKLEPPGGELVAMNLPPCRRIREVAAQSCRQVGPDRWIYDFGVNMVGWVRFQVEAESGTRLSVRFGEQLLGESEINFETGGTEHTKVIQTDTYVCHGSGPETWEPRFTYHGFRYAELVVSGGTVKGGSPGKDLLVGVVVHSDLPDAGSFECSDPTLNLAYQFGERTFAGNILGVPTDCPIRERCGWTGDAHLIVPFSMYRHDAAAFWTKFVGDMVTTARRDEAMLVFGKGMGERVVKPKEAGIPTMVAPGKRFIGEASPDWGSAIVFIPWDLYQFSGDRRGIERNYESMRQWTLHLQRRAEGGIVRSGLGDWCKPAQPGGKEGRDYYAEVIPMLSTACFYRCAVIMNKVARILERKEDERIFGNLAEEVRQAFVREFYGENATMVPDQTIHAIALEWGLLEGASRTVAAKRLADLVEASGRHFMTGVFGAPHLWPALVKNGYSSAAWHALQNDSGPSIKYLAKRGGTTFWEVWPLEIDEGEVYRRSQNHPFQGAFVSWFYSGLGGISPQEDSPGFRAIAMEPQVLEGLEWVRCRYQSPMGEIQSSWSQKDGEFRWEVVIPRGAEGRLRVPGRILRVEPVGAGPYPFVEADDAQGSAQRMVVKAGRYTLISKIR